MDADTVEAADLIITMERRHITSVAELSLAAVERTFTLTEIADLGDVVGDRRPGVTGRGVDPAGRTRCGTRARCMAMSDRWRHRRPDGGPNRAYRRTAAQIEELLDRVSHRLDVPDAT